jgi:hypothetical protein
MLDSRRVTLIGICLLLSSCGGGSGSGGTTLAENQSPLPGIPSDLAADSVSLTAIELTWTDNAANEKGFEIVRSKDGMNYLPVDTVNANMIFHLDTGLEPDTLYYYKVRAFNDAGHSAYSIPAYTTTKVGPWAKSYGGGLSDKGLALVPTEDDGVILAGSTTSFGAGDEDYWIIKTDRLGAVIWEKTYGGPLADRLSSIAQTPDGGYIVAGTTLSFGTGKSDIWILKLDAAGEIVWQKTYGGKEVEIAWTIYPTMGGKYLVSGITYSLQFNYRRTLIMKVDADGEVEWQDAMYFPFYDEAPSAPTRDGGLVFAETWYSIGPGYPYDLVAVKVDSQGAVAWVSAIPFHRHAHVRALCPMEDGGFAILSTMHMAPYSLALTKVDSQGKALWERTYSNAGVLGVNYRFEAFSVEQVEDGGFILAGSQENAGGLTDVTLTKLRASGTIAWSMVYDGGLSDEGRSARFVKDEAYLVAGFKDSYLGGNECWLMRIHLDGSVSFNPASGAKAGKHILNYSMRSLTTNPVSWPREISSLETVDTFVVPLITQCSIEQQAP